MSETETIIVIASTIAIFILIVALTSVYGRRHMELPERRAGRLGEEFATTVISEVLRAGDHLLTNVRISIGGMQTELDNVVINENGVSIIEVKNYSGKLFGDEEDSEWIMNGTGEADCLFQYPIDNPIEQVKRQVFILSEILNFNGIRAKVNGYVFFVNMNGPVKSRYILDTRDDIDRAVHSAQGECLDESVIKRMIAAVGRDAAV